MQSLYIVCVLFRLPRPCRDHVLVLALCGLHCQRLPDAMCQVRQLSLDAGGLHVPPEAVSAGGTLLVLVTHGHFDHCSGLVALAGARGLIHGGRKGQRLMRVLLPHALPGKLRQAMARMGMGEADARAAMLRADADSDGRITFDEFCAALAPMYSQNRAMLRRAFAFFDADGSGYIDKPELASMLSKLRLAPPSEAELEALFRAADTNGDQRIDFDEFIGILGKQDAVRAS